MPGQIDPFGNGAGLSRRYRCEASPPGEMQQFAMLALVSDASSQLFVYHDDGPLSLPSDRADVDQWVTPRTIWNSASEFHLTTNSRHAG
jgi:hypothetical protein